MHGAATSTGASPTTVPPLKSAHLAALVMGFIGIQFCWAVQVGYVTKSLLELGLQQSLVSYAWLAGPIAGVVVQPLAGYFSDRCTSSLGRRRPFLIGGSLLTMVMLCVFGSAEPLGRALGDPESTSDVIVRKPAALAISISAFWVLDCAINAAQGPIRALVADLVPTAQHTQANAYFACASGLGNCFGSAMGSVELSKWLPIFQSDLQALFVSAGVVLFLTMSCTVATARETPLGFVQLATDSQPGTYESVGSRTDAEERQLSMPTPASNGVSEGERNDLFTLVREAPSPFWETFAVQCLTWFGWFSLFVFATSWVGKEVLNGSFDAAIGTDARSRYDRGVRLGNLGIALQAVVTTFFSLGLPSILRVLSSQRVYLAACILQAGAQLSALVLHEEWQGWIAVVMLTSTGLPWAVTMTVPWSLMTEVVAKAQPHKAGIYVTMFNLSQCLPEIVMSLVARPVILLTGKQGAIMAMGGVSALLAGVLIIVLGVGRPTPEHVMEVENEIDDDG